jgi:hypothetical protein
MADPTRHEQVAAGLRELADFIAAHPDMPIPTYPAVACPVGSETDDEPGLAQVTAAAAILGVEVSSRSAVRYFGPVEYRVSHATRDRMARYNAAHSYEGAVQPEDGGSLDDFQRAIRDGMEAFRAGVVAELEQPAGGEHR